MKYMKVFVYYNLHRKCWSLKALEGPDRGRVVAHRDELVLDNCAFKISEAVRQKVLAHKRRYVHAGITGEISPRGAFNAKAARQISYNPYKGAFFYTVPDGAPVTAAPVRVHFGRDRRVLAQLSA